MRNLFTHLLHQPYPNQTGETQSRQNRIEPMSSQLRSNYEPTTRDNTLPSRSNFLRFIASLTLLLCLGIGRLFAVDYCQSSAFGYGASATGGGNATPVLVNSVSGLHSALNKGKNKVIIITQSLTFTELLSVQDGENVTLLGLPGVTLTSLQQDKNTSGILFVKRFNNLIIRNLTFVGPGAYDCDGNDLLCFENVTTAWVDHCDFQDGCDGNFDNKAKTDNVTVSWCRFRYLKSPRAGGPGGSDDHRYTNLLGKSSSDKPDDGTYNFTWAYCWWDNGCKERMVRCRNASLHFLNCYWNSSVANYYIGPQNVDAYVEGCYIEGNPAKDKIFYQHYGGTNGVKFINCYSAKGVPNNVSDRSVLTPSYGYTALNALDAKIMVTNATCGAGATLTVTNAGVVSSTCDGGAPAPTVYTVTWDATTNGGTCGTATTSVTSGNAIGSLPEATKSDYTFDGWYTASSGGTKISSSTTVTGNVTYYAQFTSTPVTTYYTVIWDANGGSCGTASTSVEDGHTIGSVISPLPTATKSGYTFDGWFTSVSGGTQISTSTTITANVTYYAHYTESGGGGGTCATKTIGFTTATCAKSASSGGERTLSNVTNLTVAHEVVSTTSDAIATYGNADKDGITYNNNTNVYSRGGYKWNKNTGSTIGTTNNTVGFSVTVGSGYEFTVDSISFGIAASANMVYQIIIYQSGDTLYKSSEYTFTRGSSASNYEFHVGNLSAQTKLQNLTGTFYVRVRLAFSSTGKYLFFPMFQVVGDLCEEGVTPPSSTYTLSYDENGGSGSAMSDQVGTTLTVAANSFTAPTGYAFQKWNTAMNGGGTDYSAGNSITLTEDVTLYAIWQPQTYTVTLNPGSGSGGTANVTAIFDAAMPNISVPTCSGYTFAGYFTGENGTGTQYYDENGSSTNDWTIASNTTLYAYWIEGAAPAPTGCNLHFHFFYAPDATSNSLTNDATVFTSMVSDGSSQAGSITIDGTSYSVTRRTGDNATFGTFTIPSGKIGTFYALAVSSGAGDRQINLVCGGTTYELPVAGGSDSYKRLEQGNLPAGTYSIERDGSSNVRLGVVVVKLCDDVPCPSAYSFHYGPHTGDWETPICFEQVGETHEWQITDFAIPSHASGEFYVGWQGSINPQSATKAWTDSYSEGNGAMKLLPTSTSIVGQAIGAVGTISIWNNSGWLNQNVGFTPNGYGITYGGSGHAFHTTATANMWETDVVTLPNVSTTYTMGLATATAGTYVTCAHSSAAEAISNMGVTIVAGGKKAIYLVPGSFNVAGAQYAVYDVTNSAFDTDFMSDSDGDGIYVGYVGSNCSTMILVRMSDAATTSDLSSKNWDAKWNQTANISISGDLAKKYTITSLNGDNCAYSTANMQPITGQKGKFRMWANSADNNWFVHWIPYYVLSYDGNGGTGSTAQTERNSESSTLTVTTAANGFTAPTGYEFAGWAISQAHADAGTVDYAAGASYTLTSNATLYAVWSPITYSITLNKGDHGAANQSATVAYDAMALTSITHVAPNTGYTRTGYYDGETKVLNADGTFAASNVTGYITSDKWSKADDCTLTAKWEAKTTTITINANTVNHGSTTPGTVTATYGSVLPAFTAASGESGYDLTGYWTAATDGTMIINADGTLVRNTTYSTDESTPKWNSEAAELTLYAQYEIGLDCTPQDINAASSTDLGSASTPRYVVNVTGVGRLMKDKTGSSSWSASDGKLTTGSSMFALQTYNDISEIVIYGSGTGTNRTLSKVEVGTATNNYATVSASATVIGTDDGKFTTSGAADSMHIAIDVAANSYVAITFSGNINITKVSLVSCVVPCTTPENPDGLTVGSITAIGATFTITDDETPQGYDIYYSTSSTAPTAETEATATTTEKTIAVEDLLPGRTYYAWARAVCDASHKSSWVALTGSTFTTATPSYTITYHLNGASWVNIGAATYTAGTGYSLPVAGDMSNIGYTFNGWYANSDLSTGGVVTSIGDAETGNKEFWAKWTENTYTITYNKNNGSATGSTTSTVGHYVTVAENGFTFTDHVFNGWNTEPDGSGNSYSEGEEVELLADMTLYAQWGAVVTATWSVTKIDDKLYRGGGGYSVTVYLNQADWDANGDKDDLELTATEGVILSNVTKTINGAGKAQVTADFAITTDVAADATEITFTLFVPTAGDYAAAELEHSEDLDECSGGSGTSYKIPVKSSADDQGGSATPRYLWVTSGTGWITWDAGSSTINSESASYSGFSYRTGSGKNTILIYSEIASVKKIRIYSYGSNATSCNGVATGTTYNTYTNLTQDTHYTFNGNTITKNNNGIIEIIFTTPLTANTYVKFTFSANAKFYGVEVETSGGSGGVEPTLTWETDLSGGVAKETGDPDFTHTASTISNTLGTIMYSSSNTSVATVNTTTGKVHIAGAAGEATITATLLASGCYDEATVSYNVTVTRDCDDVAGTISTNNLGCDGIEMTVTGYTSTGSETFQWYKDGVSLGGGYTAAKCTITVAGEYYVVVDNTPAGARHCDMASTNTVVVVADGVATATKIVDSWYVKNGRRTPDVALVATTDASNFKVENGSSTVIWHSNGSVTTGFGGCGFRMDEDGIIYLCGTTSAGGAPSGLSAGDETLTITVMGCGGNDSKSITIHCQAATDRPSIAFVVDGTENGAFDAETEAHSVNTPLYKYLDYASSGGEFDLTGQNIYSTVDEKAIREHYSQFDAIVITDDPNTGKKKGGKSYVDAFGTMIDVRPILTMEAYVSKLKNWSCVKGDPSSPKPRQYALRLECKDHEIYHEGLPAPAAGTHVWDEVVGDETYRYVILVDSTKSPYKGVSSMAQTGGNEKPALQGFTYAAAGHMLGLGRISGGTLQAAIERQEEPAARMIVFSIQNKALPNALTNEGKQIIENIIVYLLKTNMEEVDDCSNYFTGKISTDWSTVGNWTKNELPSYETKARILAPCVLSGVTARASQVDIATSGNSARKNEHMGSSVCNGSLTIAANAALIVGGKVRTAEAPHFANNDLKPTEVRDLAVLASSDNNGTLVLDNSAGDTKAFVQMYSKAYRNKDASTTTWQYIGIPHSDVSNAMSNYYDSWLYHWDPIDGWIVVPRGGAVEPWIGYCITYPANGHTYDMEGTLVATTNQDINVPANSFQVIGNSWTAPIQIDNFEDADFGGMTKSVYLFNTGYDADGSGELNKADGRWGPGTYVSIPIHSAPYTGDAVINSMQGFYVTNTGSAATLHLDYDKLVRPKSSQNAIQGPMHAPKRITTDSDEPVVAKLWVSGTRYDDRLVVLEREDFTRGNDDGWDGEKWDGSSISPTIWSQNEEGGVEAVTATPDMDGTIIGFRAGEDETYVFSFEYDGFDEPIYLLDTETKVYTRVLTDNTYTFTCADKGEYNRFLLTRSNGQEIPTGWEDANGADKAGAKPLKFIGNDKMFIYVRGVLYDATGKRVAERREE